MFSADSAREEADYLAMKRWEDGNTAREQAFEAFQREHGPLYHFEFYTWEPDNEDEACAIMHFGKPCRELSPAQMESVLSIMYCEGDIFRNFIVNEDGTIDYEVGTLTDDESGETLDGESFEW